MNTLEKWKTITSYKSWIFDGKYEVSNWGNIRNDEDFEKAAMVNSNSQLYKQAGNSIVKNVLMAIFNKMVVTA